MNKQKVNSTVKIVSIIMQWADQHQIYIRTTANDRFILMMPHEVLQQLRETKFTIIDKVREAAKERDSYVND